jgi:O-antigen/teichoic acid export membrane protein
LVLAASSLWFYNHEYRKYAPSFRYVKFSYARDLMSLGFKFFFIQIASIVIYQTSNIIIAQLFGPEQVTPFNIAYKYFNVISMGFGIIVMPFWSAFRHGPKKMLHG